MDVPPAEVASHNPETTGKEAPDEPGRSGQPPAPAPAPAAQPPPPASTSIFAFKPLLLDVDCLLCGQVLLEPVVGERTRCMDLRHEVAGHSRLLSHRCRHLQPLLPPLPHPCAGHCGHEFCKSCYHDYVHKQYKLDCPVAGCTEHLRFATPAVSAKLQAAVAAYAGDRVAARRQRQAEEEQRAAAQAAEAAFRSRWQAELAEHRRNKSLGNSQKSTARVANVVGKWQAAEPKFRKYLPDSEASVIIERRLADSSRLPPGVEGQAGAALQQEEARWLCYQAGWPEQALAAAVAAGALAAVLAAEEAAAEAEARPVAARVAAAAVAAALAAAEAEDCASVAAEVVAAVVAAALAAVAAEEAAASVGGVGNGPAGGCSDGSHGFAFPLLPIVSGPDGERHPLASGSMH